MIVISGPGKGGVQTLTSPYTWAYCLLNVLFAICEVYTYSLSTTFEGYVLYRSGLIVTIVVAALFFNRKLQFNDFIGSAFILLGVVYVGSNLGQEIKFEVLLTVILGTFLWVSRTFIAEFHDTSKNAKSIKDETRVTGFVLLVTSLLVLVIYAIIGFVGDEVGFASLDRNLPSLSDFKNVEGITASIFAGIFLVSFAKYAYFIAAKDVQTENYMVIATLGILLAIILEYCAFTLGIMPYDAVQLKDVAAGFMVIFGAFYIMYMRHRMQAKKPAE